MMNQTKNGKKNIGFYIALAVCIATVAAAAWTTYGSIVGQDDTSQDVGVDHEISGQAYEVDDSSEQETEPSKEEVSAQESQGSAVSEDADDEEEEEDQEEQEDTEENSREEEKSDDVSKEEDTKPVIYYPLKNAKVGKAFSMTKLLFSATTNDWRVHRGADFLAKEGSAVLASSDGVVKAIYHDGLYGEVICIEHNGYLAKYCGLTDQTIVKVGDTVTGGSPIGYIGAIPCEQSDPPHLHLEVIVGEKYIDPIIVLSGNANLNE